jgi:hypothetical protein
VQCEISDGSRANYDFDFVIGLLDDCVRWRLSTSDFDLMPIQPLTSLGTFIHLVGAFARPGAGEVGRRCHAYIRRAIEAKVALLVSRGHRPDIQINELDLRKIAVGMARARLQVARRTNGDFCFANLPRPFWSPA